MVTLMPIDLPADVHALRKRWKPIKLRLHGQKKFEGTLIRFHRACSWMQRVQDLPEDALDEQLVLRWVAFNALYGQWDADRREPQSDKLTMDRFSSDILKLDADGVIATVLQEQHTQVMAIFEDEFVNAWFWEDPRVRAKPARKARFDARTWYVQRQWRMIQDRLLERIYFVRCQLVHGGATYASKLNRGSVKRCAALLDVLLRAWLLVWLDHGALVDWGLLCYPPQDPSRPHA